MCARLARGEREWERNEEESRVRKRMSEHACTLTRSRARMVGTHADGARVLGCENRRAKSNQWRAEAGIGGVTHVVNERPIRAPSPVDFELVSRSVHRVCVHAWERRTTEGEKGKKKQESARTSKERATNSRKRKRERLAMAEEKKKKRDEFASRLDSPLYPGRQRGEGERQKEGHNMPYERAPWTSHCGLAEERRAGRKVRRRRKEKERARGGRRGGGEFLGQAASRREGKRQTWRTRASLKLGAIGESHFCEDTPAGLHRRRFLRSSCWRTATGSASDSHNSAAFQSSEGQTEKSKERERERETAHTVVAYPRIERLAVGQLRREEASSGKQKKVPSPSRTDLVAEVVQGPRASRVCSPWPARDPRSDPRRVRDPAKSYIRVPSHQGYTIGRLQILFKSDLTRAIFPPIIAGTTYLFLPASHPRQPLCDRRDLRRNPRRVVSARPSYFPPGPRRPRVYDEVSTRGIGYASPRARAPNCRFRRAWYTWPSRVLGGSRHHSVEKRAASHHVKALRGQSAVRLQRERSQATLPRAQPGVHHDPGEARRLRLRRLRRSVHGRSGDRQAERWVANVKWITLTLPLMLPITLYTLLLIAATTTTPANRGEKKKSKRSSHPLHAALPIFCILIKLAPLLPSILLLFPPSELM